MHLSRFSPLFSGTESGLTPFCTPIAFDDVDVDPRNKGVRVTNHQLFNPLDPQTRDALRASIIDRGVLVPVVVDQHGDIIDGHNRAAIADELNVTYERVTVDVDSDIEAREVAATLNAVRRQLSTDDRRDLVRLLALDVDDDGIGRYSTTAIAEAVGITQQGIAFDLNHLTSTCKVDPADLPERRWGKDGKTYPAQRSAPHDSEPLFDENEPDAIADELANQHNGHNVTDHDIATAVAGNVESKREPTKPKQKPTKPDLGNGISHPARYSNTLSPVFAELLTSHVGKGATVLDPFAGTGKIHELYPEFETYGIELEPEWANLDSRTQIGNALALPFANGTFDAIVTSPTYGNRLADHHDAKDDSIRRSYTHDLGRQLHPENSGQMQFNGPGQGSLEYREFHTKAWSEATTALRPGGVFILNIKDHVRSGLPQLVPTWHAAQLGRLGLDLVHWQTVPTPHLRQGSNFEARTEEMVLTFQSPIPRP